MKNVYKNNYTKPMISVAMWRMCDSHKDELQSMKLKNCEHSK